MVACTFTVSLIRIFSLFILLVIFRFNGVASHSAAARIIHIRRIIYNNSCHPALLIVPTYYHCIILLCGRGTINIVVFFLFKLFLLLLFATLFAEFPA